MTMTMKIKMYIKIKIKITFPRAPHAKVMRSKLMSL